jgi:hypothetical protein
MARARARAEATTARRPATGFAGREEEGMVEAP